MVIQRNTVLEKTFNLNVFRSVFCLILAYAISRGAFGYDKLYFSEGPFSSINLFDYLQIGQLNLSTVTIIRTALIGCLIAAALGIYTRVSLFLAALLYFMYFGNQLGFIKSPFSDYVHHSKNLAFYLLLIMSFAPEIKRFAVDGLKLNNWKGWSKEAITSGFHGIDAAQWMLGLAYLGSALSKLMQDLQWADGHTLQSYMFRKYLLYDNEFGYMVLQNLALCKGMSIITLLFEGTFILCLFFRRLQPFYVIGGLVFHLMINFTMSIDFGVYFYLGYLAFINYARIPGFNVMTSRIKKSIPVDIVKVTLRNPAFRGQCVLAAIVAIQLVSVVFELENWPLSNYGVFTGRHILSDIKEYRFVCCCDYKDDYQSIPREYLPRSQTTLSRMIRLAKDNQSEQEVKKVFNSVKSFQIQFNPECSELVLMKGWGEVQNNGKITRSFIPVYQEFIDNGLSAQNLGLLMDNK